MFLHTLARWFQRHASTRTILWTTAGTLLVNPGIFSAVKSRLHPGIPQPRPLDLYLYYDPTTVRTTLQALGPAGRASLPWIAFTLDLVYPLFYGSLIALLLTRLHRSKAEKWLWLPLLTVGADLAENTLLSLLTVTYPTFPEWMACTAPGATFLKWAGLTGSLFGILLGFLLTARMKPASHDPLRNQR